MSIRTLAVLVSVMVFAVPVCATAQTCTDEQMDTILDCLDGDGLTTCLLNTDCTQADVNNAISSDTIGDNVKANCCDKARKRRKISCFRQARAFLRSRSGKRVIPSDVRTDVLDDVVSEIAYIRENDECSD